MRATNHPKLQKYKNIEENIYRLTGEYILSDWSLLDHKELIKASNGMKSKFWAKYALEDLYSNNRKVWKKLTYLTRGSATIYLKSILEAVIKRNICVCCKSQFSVNIVCGTCDRISPDKAHSIRYKARDKKLIATNLIKYGVARAAQNPSVANKGRITHSKRTAEQKAKTKKKTIRTNLAKFGTASPMQNKDILNKVSKTWRSKSTKEISSITKKRQGTYKERTGFTSPRLNPEVLAKAAKTYKDRTGYAHNTHNPESLARRDATNLERYGTKHPAQNKDIIDKSRKTSFANHGGIGKGSASLRQRIEATCMQLYGYPIPTQNKTIMDKCKKTWLKKYGFEYPNQNPEQALKGLKTALKIKAVEIENKIFRVQGSYEDELLRMLVGKFGVRDVFTSFHKAAKRARERQGIQGVPDFYIKSLDKFIECKSIWTLLGPNNVRASLEKAEKNKSVWLIKIRNKWLRLKGQWWLKPNIPLEVELQWQVKHGIFARDLFENNVLEYCKRFYSDCYLKNHCIYNTKLKLAIDLRCLYFDSTATMSNIVASKLIITRLEAATAKGWRLITIWDYQWNTQGKRTTIKSYLKRLLINDDKSFYARKCTFEIVKAKDIKEFFDAHHIQGSVRSGTAYCLKYKNKLVASMVFDTLRSVRGSKSVNGHYELTRYATSNNVPGGASRLLSKFIADKNPSKIISYSDNQFFTGAMYKKLNFNIVSVSRPDYKVWFDSDSVKSKHFTKRSHLAIIPGFDPALSESQNCIQLGLHRIYDAGKIKWERS